MNIYPDSLSNIGFLRITFQLTEFWLPWMKSVLTLVHTHWLSLARVKIREMGLSWNKNVVKFAKDSQFLVLKEYVLQECFDYCSKT